MFRLWWAERVPGVHAARVENPLALLSFALGTAEEKLDFSKVLQIADRCLPKDMPFLLEHMQTDAEYKEAYDYVAGIAKAAGIPIR